MTYDEIIQKAGKRIRKHVYYIKDGVRTNVSDESVERIKFDLQSPLIGTSINGCEITLKEKIDGDIYVTVEARYGENVATKTYGAYHLKEEPTYDANKKTYLHKTYDNLIKSMVDYEPVNLVFPVTIFTFFEAVIQKVGYTTNIASLPNGNQQMPIDIFNNIGFTYRDVLDDIAVANGVLFYIDGNELKIAQRGGDAITIDDDVLKNQNIQFGEHFGAVNTIVLSRSGESDNIYYPTELPENPIEFKIVDNQLMNENNRSDFLPALYNQLNGVEYDIYDTELTGWGDVRPLQTVNFETGGKTYSSYIFNNEITLTDGYKQAIYNELPSETETDYKAASKTDKTINQAYIIVRKNEAEIESLARRVVDVSNTKQGVGNIQLENAYEGQLYQLSIKGQISLLFSQNEDDLYGYSLAPSNELVPSNDLVPSSPVPYQNEVLYPSDQLFSKGSYLLVDDTRYKLDFDFLNYIDNDVCDEFVYDNGTCYIIRRVGIDDEGNKYHLDKEVIEARRGVAINVDKESTISLESFDNAILKATYLLDNAYTDNFTTEIEVQSEIKQTADSITSQVSATYATKQNLQDVDASLTSTIQQTAQSITSTVSETYETKSNAQSQYSQIQQTTNSISQTVATKVGANEIISKINQSAESVSISAGKINLNGVVTANQNFKILSDGSMEAKSGKFSGLISAGKIEVQGYTEQNPYISIGDFENNGGVSPYGTTIWDNGITVADYRGFEPLIRTEYTGGYAELSYGDVNCSGHVTSIEGVCQGSLEEIKKDFEKLDSGLNILSNIDIYKYHYKEEKENVKKHIGLVIGKNYKYSTEVTNKNNDAIDLYSFISVCCKAIQEQQEEIESLKKEMEELKNAKN